MVRSWFEWAGFGPASLVDVTGRRLLRLAPGRNDISRLCSGVYAVITANGGIAEKVMVVR